MLSRRVLAVRGVVFRDDAECGCVWCGVCGEHWGDAGR